MPCQNTNTNPWIPSGHKMKKYNQLSEKILTCVFLLHFHSKQTKKKENHSNASILYYSTHLMSALWDGLKMVNRTDTHAPTHNTICEINHALCTCRCKFRHCFIQPTIKSKSVKAWRSLRWSAVLRLSICTVINSFLACRKLPFYPHITRPLAAIITQCQWLIIIFWNRVQQCVYIYTRIVIIIVMKIHFLRYAK